MVQIKNTDKGDVWFVYDGECPICQIAASGLAIRKAVGKLHLIDARDDHDHPVVKEINAKGLNLDTGMVIKFGGVYYHGNAALQVMALLGSKQGRFNRIMYLLFRSAFFGRLIYPFMRGARNFLIFCKGVGKINNLQNAQDKFIIFQNIFGDQWNGLPPVMRKHYANRAYTNDVTVMEGIMTVESSTMAKLMSPAFRLLGTLVPYEDKDIPVTVTALSNPNTAQYIFDREFRFKDRKVYRFKSAMEHVAGKDVVEFMRFGVGWRSAFNWDGEKVTLEHRGYVWRIFGVLLPLPMTWLMGKGYAEEIPLSKSTFKMKMYIHHPWWGKIYEYRGTFKIVS